MFTSMHAVRKVHQHQENSALTHPRVQIQTDIVALTSFILKDSSVAAGQAASTPWVLAATGMATVPAKAIIFYPVKHSGRLKGYSSHYAYSTSHGIKWVGYILVRNKTDSRCQTSRNGLLNWSCDCFNMALTVKLLQVMFTPEFAKQAKPEQIKNA